MYNTNSAMTIVELVKFLLSFAQHAKTSKSTFQEIFFELQHVEKKVVVNYFLLALSYAVYNQLIFVVLKLTDPGTFSLFKSLSPLLVGVLNWIVFGGRLTHLQCLIILMQFLGIIPVVLSVDSENGSSKLDVELQDFILIMFVCFMASFNTVYNAAMIKKEVAPVTIQNMILYAFGAGINFLFYHVFQETNHKQSFFYGYGHWGVVLLLFLNSFVGIAITFIYKFGDAVLKSLTAPFISSILVFISYIFFGLNMSIIKLSGAAIVIINTFVYLDLPNPTNKTPDDEKNKMQREFRTLTGMLFIICMGLQLLSNNLWNDTSSLTGTGKQESTIQTQTENYTVTGPLLNFQNLEVESRAPFGTTRGNASVTFDLVFNAKIVKWREQETRNRFERLDIFLWTLKSYSQLNSLERVFLYVELDEEYNERKTEVETEIAELFGSRLKILKWERYGHQDDYRKMLWEIGKKDGTDDHKLVWFLQNDDHVFIDMNEDVFQEGLERMAKDDSPRVTMYPSHWPEILKLSGKVESPQVCGSFIKVQMTLSDGLQVMNFGHMRYLLDELDWNGRNYTRMDSVAMDPRIWTDPDEVSDPDILSLQTMYIPLRELCRKFDGYQAQGIGPEKVPWLVLPPEKNTFDRSYNGLVAMLTGPTPITLWCKGNHFQLPVEYVGRIFELYRGLKKPSTSGCISVERPTCLN